MTLKNAVVLPSATPASLFAGSRLRRVSAVLSISLLTVSAWSTFLNNGTQPDVSWLLTVGEKMLAGQTLYVDILETNPPFSIYLYFPMIWLGVLTPLSAEVWTKLVTCLWVLFFGAVALRMARRLRLISASETAILAPAGIYILLLISPHDFSQREHFAVASALPMLVLAAWRMISGDPRQKRLGWVLIAGFGAAVTMMVKPHYALVFLLPYLLAAWSARSLRVLFDTEILAAAAIVIACGAVMWQLHPLYITEMVPLLLDVYTYRHSLGVLLVKDWEQIVFGAVLAGLLLSVTPRRENPLPWAFGAAAIGFFCAFLILGKGWPYHTMPGLSLTLIAIVLAGARWAFAELDKKGGVPIGAIFIALHVAAGVAVSHTALYWSIHKPSAPLIARLNAVVANPAVASVSPAIAIGHPLTRSLSGRWIERMCSDWLVAGGVLALLEPDLPTADRKRIEARINETKSRKLAGWKATPPDIVFLDEYPIESIAGLSRHLNLAPLLENYRVVANDGPVNIALRSDLLPAWEAATARASSPGAASD